jgi:hypothetical protein
LTSSSPAYRVIDPERPGRKLIVSTVNGLAFEFASSMASRSVHWPGKGSHVRSPGGESPSELTSKLAA